MSVAVRGVFLVWGSVDHPQLEAKHGRLVRRELHALLVVGVGDRRSLPLALVPEKGRVSVGESGGRPSERESVCGGSVCGQGLTLLPPPQTRGTQSHSAPTPHSSVGASPGGGNGGGRQAFPCPHLLAFTRYCHY